MSEAVLVVVLALAIGAPLVLYAFVREETANPRIVDRETAEREAREQGGLEDGDARGSPERTDHRRDSWGSDESSSGPSRRR